MAAVSPNPRNQPSTLLSTGLSVATVALNVAGAAVDAVPIAKQILNSAAHISAAAEKIVKKREAMYLLVERADIYATQIDIAVAGRILDAPLHRRLERLLAIFARIEVLVGAKAGGTSNALTRAWQKVVTKPNRAETLVVELEREIQLFQLLTGIQLSLVADDTARAIAADARYDGQCRILRDCDIEKLKTIDQRETDEGAVVWASALVKRQLMAVRYVDAHPIARGDDMFTPTGSPESWVPFADYLGNIKKVSTVRGSHPHIVQLYGRHVHGPETVFRSGTFPLSAHIRDMRSEESNLDDETALKQLILAYKILVLITDVSQIAAHKPSQDAASHLEDTLSLAWIGTAATIDENGEPRIGLFDDIAHANSRHRRRISPRIYFDIFVYYNSRWSEEIGVVEQVHASFLHTTITAQLRYGNGTDRLRRVWNIVRQEQLPVNSSRSMFPIISRNLSVSREMIARAQRYFERITTERTDGLVSFVLRVLAGGSNMSSRILVSFKRLAEDHEDGYLIHVATCTHDDVHVLYDEFDIFLTAEFPRLAEVARAVGLPDDFDTAWDGGAVDVYERVWTEGEEMETYDEGRVEDATVSEDDAYETAEEGEETED